MRRNNQGVTKAENKITEAKAGCRTRPKTTAREKKVSEPRIECSRACRKTTAPENKVRLQSQDRTRPKTTAQEKKVR